MRPSDVRPPSAGGSEPRSPNQRRATALSWLLLLLLFGGMWLWQSGAETRGHPDVDYSTLYGWAEQGKLGSATLKGRLLGSLRAPTTVDGRQVSQVHTELPERDDSLLPRSRRTALRWIA
jgi:hypothetical protein